MIDPSLFWKSFGIGLAVAAPVGPMSLLCMRRALTPGWRSALATGVGIAMGDGSFAGVAALGLVGLSRFMLAHQAPLHLAAGLFLIWLGLACFRRKRRPEAASPAETHGLTTTFAGAWLLTLTNPPTIIMFAAVFAALAPRAGLNGVDAAVTVGGVFCGSLVWWSGLVGVITLGRGAIGPAARRRIDQLSGVILTLFGVAELRRAI